MNGLKRVIAALLAGCVVFSLCACGKKVQKETPDETKKAMNCDDVVTTQTPVYSETYTQETYFDTQSQTVAATEVPATQAPQQTQAAQTTSSIQTPAETVPQTATGVGKYVSTYNSVEQAVFFPNRILNDDKIYPVIVWANGTSCPYTLYESLLMQLAEGGYIVVANSETMAADGTAQRASIDFIISENNNSSSELCGKINTNKIAAAGHSQGGRSSVNAASVDGRIACVYSLAGSNFDYEAEKLTAPAFFVTGTSDMIVSSSRWVQPAYDLCKGPAVYASLSGGVHTTCCTDPAKYSAYAIDWFDIWLKGDNSKKSVFQTGGALATDSAWVDFQSKGI